ncbi:hypothetical protein [Streptomyces sp. NPDC047829]|uniref:hypothetical protein n=1 Tax=Streptomyces sp. NPDC047829 TaxID=3154609 RepID=UPI003410466A
MPRESHSDALAHKEDGQRDGSKGYHRYEEDHRATYCSSQPPEGILPAADTHHHRFVLWITKHDPHRISLPHVHNNPHAGFDCGATTPRWPAPVGKFPAVADHHLARRWLQFMANIGRPPNTIDAYGRAAEAHLQFCAMGRADPLLSRPDTIAAWIRDMLDRASSTRKGPTTRRQVSRTRPSNSASGQASRGGRRPRRGLVRHIEQAPWIPSEESWQRILGEPHGIGLVIFRYVAERAIAWLHGFPLPAHPLGET